MLNLQINKNSNMPVYRQIIEGVTTLIKAGKILPGDKLPSERELAIQFGLARGTIKKAYEKLAVNNVIEMIHGRGSFVSFKQDVVETGRKDKAIQMIDRLITRLEHLNFSYREIGNLFDLKIMEREMHLENFFIAAVDCNPECLDLFERQLGHLAQVNVGKFLLDEVSNSEDPQAKLSSYELIVTTSTHYSELIGMLPQMKDKIMQIVLSSSQEAVINLAKISSTQKIGIVCNSKKFKEIIRTQLKSFQVPLSNVSHFLRKKDTEFPNFIKDKQVLIVPPVYYPPTTKESAEALQQFRERGGLLIKFDYQIERGSLLYVEERLKKLLER